MNNYFCGYFFMHLAFIWPNVVLNTIHIRYTFKPAHKLRVVIPLHELPLDQNFNGEYRLKYIYTRYIFRSVFWYNNPQELVLNVPISQCDLWTYLSTIFRVWVQIAKTNLWTYLYTSTLMWCLDSIRWTSFLDHFQ